MSMTEQQRHRLAPMDELSTFSQSFDALAQEADRRAAGSGLGALIREEQARFNRLLQRVKLPQIRTKGGGNGRV